MSDLIRIPLDEMTSDQLDDLYERVDRANAALRQHRECGIDRITALEAEVARLTAGQCTHALHMCQQHHAVPVDGCPYPKCKTARTAATA